VYFSNNLKYLRRSKKFSQQELADQLEIKRPNIGAYEEARATPSFDVLLKIVDLFDVSTDMLLRVDLSKTDSSSLMKVGENRILFPITVDDNNDDLIEVVPVRAAAGYLVGYSDPEYIESLQKMKLPFMPTGKHRAFPIRGDSMPPCKDGSFVVGKFVERWQQIKDGKTYIIITKSEGIVYKRVTNKIIPNGYLELHSDNPIYETYNVLIEDVLEVWEFTCYINTDDYREDELNQSSILNMFKSLQIELQQLKSKNNEN